MPSTSMQQPERKPRWLDEAPAWLSSTIVHVAILAVLSLVTWVVIQPQPESVVRLGTQAIDADALTSAGDVGDNPLVNDRAEGSEHIEMPDQTPLPAPTQLAEFSPPSLPAPDLQSGPASPSDPAMAIFGDPGAETIRSGEGGQGLLDGTSGEFQRLVKTLRAQGIDVVFVLDATESMSPYIEQSKRRMLEIMGVITGALADGEQQKIGDVLRFGVVAFKDYGDEYGDDASKRLKLTHNQKEVREFIEGLVASGGADRPEPIDAALDVATDDKMGWRRANKVIVLIGDAPVHSTGRARVMRIADDFARRRGQINVIDVGGAARGDEKRQFVLPDFKSIAARGKGSAFLLEEESAFWRHLIVSVFGREYEHDVERLVERYVELHKK